jgi:hypothetical protein
MKIEDLNSNAAAPKEFVNTIVFGLVTSIPLEVIRTMWYHMAILSLGQKVITSIIKIPPRRFCFHLGPLSSLFAE